MHFVAGGAFNGKAQWVKKEYELHNVSATWHSAYAMNFDPKAFETTEQFTRITVLQGIEKYIKTYVQCTTSAAKISESFREQCDLWREWERSSSDRKLIIIGNDLSKGIVPITKEDRLWRDITGWCYQTLTAQSERVDRIWYGLAKRLK